MPNEQVIKNVAIYSRKSKFTGKGESIDNQIELCKDYLKIHYSDLYDDMNIDIYEDEGYSGGNINRPQFQEMLKAINKKKYDTVICYRLDRISRNTSDFANLMKLFEKLNVFFISIRDKFDTTTPTGVAMMMMVSVFAQLERDTIAERIKDNMHELAKTGRWLGGTTPTGYKSRKVESLNLNGKKKSAYMLDIIDDEMEIVKIIYNKFMETNSLTQTETYLMNECIVSKNNNSFTRFTIKNILENPVYMIADECALEYFKNEEIDIFSEDDEFDGIHGIMAYNKTKQINGSVHIKNNIDDWIVAVGKHKGVIQGREWVKVQKMLYQNKSKAYRKPKSNIALLSGVLFCGHCGSYMRPKQVNRLNKDKERVFYYLCERKDKSRNHLCEAKNISGNILDKLVCEEIKKLSEDSSELFRQLNKLKKSFSKLSESNTERIKDLEKRKSKNNKMIQNCIAAFAENKSELTGEYLNKEIERLDSENTVLTNKIEELHQLDENDMPDVNILKDMVSSFAKTFDMMNLEEKRAAIRALIKRIVWDGENIHIYFMGSDDDLFPFGDNSK